MSSRALRNRAGGSPQPTGQLAQRLGPVHSVRLQVQGIEEADRVCEPYARAIRPRLALVRADELRRRENVPLDRLLQLSLGVCVPETRIRL